MKRPTNIPQGAGLNRPMSRRRVLAIGGLGATVAAAGLAGCGSGGSSGKKSKKITVMVSQSPTAADGQKRILDLLKQKFADANPGASVDFQVVQLGSAVTTAITTTAASHEGPDIFEIGPNNLPAGQAAGVFTQITDAEWADLGGKNRYLASIVGAMGKAPDSLVAIPYYASTMQMYYNKSMYAQAGIAAPPTTWSDFVTVGQKLSTPASGRYAVAEAAAEPTQPWHVIWLLTTQLGGRFISEDGHKAQLDSAEVLSATSFWLDWMGKYRIVSPRDASNTSAQQVQSFVNGHAAMFPCGFTQAISSMPGTAVANDWALAANPTVPYGQTSPPSGQQPVQTYLGGATWAISKYAADRDLALSLAKLMGDADVQQLTWKEVGGLPVTNETFTAHPETRQGVWKVIYEAALAAQATPWSPSFPQVTPLLAAAVKPSFAAQAGGRSYDMKALRAALQTANQKLQVALDSEGK
jgi:multiple sugar transport system substrate-binding protein